MMGIGAVARTIPAISTVRPTNISVDPVMPVAETAAGDAGNIDPGKADVDTVRAALDARIAEDVSTGTLTPKDAGSIRRALGGGDSAATTDDADTGDAAPVDASADVDVTSAAGGPARSPGGGKGDSGSAVAGRTEVSRDVTTAGSVKVTTVGYSDGSSESLTEIASDADLLKVQPAGPDAAGYQPVLAKGSIVSALA